MWRIVVINVIKFNALLVTSKLADRVLYFRCKGAIKMSRKKIIIDAGHGGSDPGAVCGQYKEKDWNLEISQYMAEELKQKGYDVSLTRRTDITLNPSSRTEIVRNSGADLCISNHINAGGGEGSEIIHSIYSDGKLATLILDELVKEGMRRRRIYSRQSLSNPQKDYYYIIRDTYPIETVIVEYGFIDNLNDREKLNNPIFRITLAKAAARGVDSYLSSQQDSPPQNQGMIVKIIDIHGNTTYLSDEYKILSNGRWYVQARHFTEIAGGIVSWNSEKQEAVFDFSRILKK